MNSEIPLVTDQELREYILKQPDKRKVNMCNGSNNGVCGCAMVHLGLDKGWNFNDALLHYGWRDSKGNSIATIEGEGDIMNVWWDRLFTHKFNNTGFVFPKTYGELKKLLK